MAENGKIHPECPNAVNPYHECFEECYVKMGKPKPQMVKSFSGLAGRDPASRRKNRESNQKKKKLDKVTTFPYVSTVEPDHDSTIESEKRELDNNNNKAAPLPVPYSGEIHPEDFSFNKGQIKSSQSVPTSGQATHAITNSPDFRMNGHTALFVSTPLRNGHADKHVNSRELLLSVAANEPPLRAKHAPLRSTSSSITDNERQYQESDDDDVQSIISEARVAVGKYYVKESMAPILRAIIEKYGDIAENCLMESVSMRSCSLECICLVIQELQSTSFTQLTTSKIKEMLTILKDLEKSYIRVDWLQWILNELSELSEVIARHQQRKSEKNRFESRMDALKKELEVQSEDLTTKEREVEEAKSLVTETRDRIRRGELESSMIVEEEAALRSQLEGFRFNGLISELI